VSAVGCAELERFVHPYVDGEFEAEDRALFERHLLECQRCRELVSFQSSFKSHLRARLAHRPASVPDQLRRDVARALDRADARGEGPVPRVWKRSFPLGTAALAVALLALLLGKSVTSQADGALADEMVRAHQKQLPVEVGGTPENQDGWMRGKVSFAPHCPKLRGGGAQRVAQLGARLSHVRNRDAAQYVFEVEGSRRITVFVFDASGLDLTAGDSELVAGRPMYYAQVRGYPVVLWVERGIGYGMVSDLDREEMVQLISRALTPPQN
jgi:anti-sigma factor RsiW